MPEPEGVSSRKPVIRRPAFHRPLVIAVGLMTLGSGIVKIISAAGKSLPERHASLREFFPLEFLHLSRFLSLLVGFALVVSSLNIIKRKKRAFFLVLCLSGLSVVFHLTKGLDYEEAALSLVLVGALLFARGSFTVKSSIPDLRSSLAGLFLAVGAVLLYGSLGFWLLDKRDFGIFLTVPDAILCVCGEKDDAQTCGRLDPARTRSISVRTGHRFGGNFAPIAAAVLQELNR